MVESMQQSSATPSLHFGFLGLRKIVACSQPYLAVASCIYSFWHDVIPTSYFIFNDFYTCIYSISYKTRSYMYELVLCLYQQEYVITFCPSFSSSRLSTEAEWYIPRSLCTNSAGTLLMCRWRSGSESLRRNSMTCRARDLWLYTRLGLGKLCAISPYKYKRVHVYNI